MINNQSATGNLLLVKIGTEPKLEQVVDQLRILLPQVKLLGVETENPNTRNIYDSVVAHSADTVLASYPEYFSKGLFLDRTIFKKLIATEGLLLRATQTTVIHDLSIANHPPFPVPRFRDTVEDRLQLVYRHLAYWDYIFQRDEVTAVVSQNYGHNPFGLSIESIARARGIPVLFFHEVRPFLESLYICETINDLSSPSFGQSLIAEAGARGWLYPDSETRRKRMRSQTIAKSQEPILSPTIFYRYAQKGNAIVRSATHFRSNFFRKTLESLKKEIRTKRSQDDEKSAATTKVPNKYFLMELQSQPNGTTLRKGWMYPDQREAIAEIAFNLPDEYSLLVRESPRQWARRYPRRPNFWSVISSLPKVIVVDPTVDITALIDGATALVETSYSTQSFNALSQVKPVLVLGVTHLWGVTGVVGLENFESTKDAIKQVLENAANPPPKGELIDSLENLIDLTKNSTLEGALSSTPTSEPNLIEYLDRITQNVAAIIATWYLRIQS